MGIKLEVGKRYVDREGRVYGPLFAVDDAWYPFECRVRNENWTDDGRYYHNDTEDSSRDLIIALAPDEAQQSSESDGALLLAYEKALIVAARNLDPEALSKPTVVELRATILARLSQTDELATLRADAIKDAEAIGRMRAQQDLMQLEIDRLKADARALRAENARLGEALDIDAMVSRFLSWRLPKTFNPDGHIRFDRSPDARGNLITWPVGTNLFTYEQAVSMVRHMIAEDGGSG